VRAAFRIDALVSQPQPLYRLPSHQMLFHDSRRVIRTHVAIPDCLGINHHGRSVFALIQAAGFVNSNRISQPGGLCQLLQLSEQFTLAISRTRWARSTFRANVMTHKDVVLEWRQKILLPIQITGSTSSANFPQFTAPDQPHLRECLFDYEHGQSTLAER